MFKIYIFVSPEWGDCWYYNAEHEEEFCEGSRKRGALKFIDEDDHDDHYLFNHPEKGACSQFQGA